VRAMAGFGVPQPDIATQLDIDPKTLRKYFRQELGDAGQKCGGDDLLDEGTWRLAREA
jgi:hypothetical protein